MGYRARVEIALKQGHSDPEGETTAHSLIELGYPVTAVSVSKTYTIDLEATSRADVEGKIDDARTNCSIVAYSQDNAEIARWNFENAWPSKVIGPDMDAGSTTYMVEDVTIVHEGVERVS